MPVVTYLLEVVAPLAVRHAVHFGLDINKPRNCGAGVLAGIDSAHYLLVDTLQMSLPAQKRKLSGVSARGGLYSGRRGSSNYDRTSSVPISLHET